MNDEAKKCVELIGKAVTNLKTALDQQLSQIEENFKKTSGDIHAKVAERKVLAVTLKLDKKLTEIWEEVQHYPYLCKRDAWLNDRLCEIDFPQAHKSDKETQVAFTLNDHGYKFIYHDGGTSTGFDGDVFHHSRLSLHDEADATLIEIKISIERDDVGSVLKPFDVSAFVPGTWMQDFLECYERFQANKKLRDLKKRYDNTKASDLRQKFGL